MIIDFHMHIFSDAIAERAMAQLADNSGIVPQTNGTLHDTIGKMKAWGIDTGVLMNIATKPSQHAVINNFATANNNGTPFYSFGSVFPVCESAESKATLETELVKIKKAGLKGIKLHPDYQGFMSDDKNVFPVYEICSSLGLYITFHGGYDPYSKDLIHNPPHRMRAVADNFPNLKIIAAHMGGYSLWDETEKFLVGTKLILDTSMSAHVLSKKQAERIINSHGAEKILFGSDCPWESPKMIFEYIDSLPLTSAQKDLIFEKNAKNILCI